MKIKSALDQLIAGGLRLRQVFQDIGNRRISQHVTQPVRTQQQAVSGLKDDVINLGLNF